MYFYSLYLLKPLELLLLSTPSDYLSSISFCYSLFIQKVFVFFLFEFMPATRGSFFQLWLFAHSSEEIKKERKFEAHKILMGEEKKYKGNEWLLVSNKIRFKESCWHIPYILDNECIAHAHFYDLLYFFLPCCFTSSKFVSYMALSETTNVAYHIQKKNYFYLLTLLTLFCVQILINFGCVRDEIGCLDLHNKFSRSSEFYIYICSLSSCK